MKIVISEKDLVYRPFRSSGAGGQHKNTTLSAIELTHVPTGIKAVSSMRSQFQSKKNAKKVLMARLTAYYKKLYAPKKEINEERVRTYHEPDNRVTDHLSGLQQEYKYVVDKNHLDDMIEARALAKLLDGSDSGDSSRL